jgi:hypothetical protein
LQPATQNSMLLVLSHDPLKPQNATLLLFPKAYALHSINQCSPMRAQLSRHNLLVGDERFDD